MKDRVPSNRTNFNKGRRASRRVANILSRNYLALKTQLRIRDTGNYLSMSYEDMFHNAILLTIQDDRARKLTTDKQVLKYFEYKFKCVVREIIKDSRLITNICYADNQQTEEDTED